jgi:hypothetical protein
MQIKIDKYINILQKETNQHPCGGGFKYLHHDPPSRRRRRKGSLKSERLKYGHECQETRNRERLGWRGPAAYIKDSFRQRGRRRKQDSNCQHVINIWGVDTKTY